MVDIRKIITMRDGVVSELGRRRIVPARNRKFADSPLEGAGFELSVPRDSDDGFRSNSPA